MYIGLVPLTSLTACHNTPFRAYSTSPALERKTTWSPSPNAGRRATEVRWCLVVHTRDLLPLALVSTCSGEYVQEDLL